MTIQDVTLTVKNNSSGLGRSNARKTVAVIGACAAGTANTVYAYSSKTKLVAAHTGGVAVEAAASILDEAGGQVLLVPVTKSVAGTNSAVTSAGTSPPTATLSGAPIDSYSWRMRCTLGGARGTAVVQISRDGGNTWDAPIVTAASIPDYKGSGVTIALASATFSTDNTWSWESTAPMFGTTDIADAFAALLLDPRRWKLAYVVGQAGGVSDTARCDAQAALAAAVQTQLSSAANSKRWGRALLDTPRPVTDEDTWMAALAASSAFGSLTADRIAVAAGDIDQLSPVTRLTMRRPFGFEVASRIAKSPLSVDISAVDENESGPLPARVRALYHDEFNAPGLDAARFITSRSFPGIDPIAYYITDCPTMAAADSDYARLTACLVVDEACHVAYPAMLKFLSKRFEVDPDTGYLVERDAVAAEQFVAAKLSKGIVQTGDATGIAVEVGRDDDLRIAPPTLNWELRVFTWVYPKGINVNIGVTPPSIAFAA